MPLLISVLVPLLLTAASGIAEDLKFRTDQSPARESLVEDLSASLGMRALVESATGSKGSAPIGSLSSYSLGSNHLSLKLPADCGTDDLRTKSTLYNLRAPFHILYVQVTFLGSECCRINHGDVELTTRVANFSLGIGGNSLSFSVSSNLPSSRWRRRRKRSSSDALLSNDSNLFVDVVKGDSSGSDACRRIQLNIRRLERPQLAATGEESLQVCQLLQECDFIHNSSQACGLQPMAQAPGLGDDVATRHAATSWLQFLRLRTALPPCHFDRIASGARWLVPCSSCDAHESCAWRLARWWHPECRVTYPEVRSLRRKLEKYRLVFLGDSTLRGLMFSLYFTVNGSLNRWEKSHDTMVMHDSAGRTRMAFSYYPQFWKPANQTLSFGDSLEDILAKSQVDGRHDGTTDATGEPGSFNKTAIIIGGAQWLTGRMLDQTRDLLNRHHLTAASVIVKDFSPGFHIKVPGVLFKPLSRDATLSLAQRNAELHSRAASHGFSVLPTFGPTAARFREFHPGKCACHFHSVRRVRQARRRQRQRQRRQLREVDSDYAVDGDIHWTCAKLLTSLLDHVLR